MSATIEVKHRSRPAYVYVRQSTLAQVRHNQESTERQYALRDWPLNQPVFRLFCRFVLPQSGIVHRVIAARVY